MSNEQPLKVLVVDDEIHIVQVVAIKLRNNGFDVITCENGAQALRLAVDEKPNIIITDVQMPVMTGIELVQNLRNNPDTAELPVIMLTARGFEIEDRQKEELNISAYVSKPFSPRELLQNVEEVLKEAVAV